MLRAIYSGILVAVLLASAGTYLANGLYEVYAPYELDYGEGIVLWQAKLLPDLSLAYKRITEYPYIVFHYPPLFHFTARIAAWWTQDLLSGGRLVSLLSAMGIGAVMALLVFFSVPRRVPRFVRATAAVGAGGLMYQIPALILWTPVMRVDMLALFFTFSGIALFVTLGKRPAWQCAAFGCFVLALYTKQTMLAAPLACLIACAIIDYKRALRMLLFPLILGGAALAFLATVTHGEFLRHLFLYNQNPLRIPKGLRRLRWDAQDIGPLVALACSLGVMHLIQAFSGPAGRRLRRLRTHLQASGFRRAVFISSLHMCFAFGTSLTIVKEGSNMNYFLEWNLAACSLAGLLLARLLSQWRGNVALSPSAVAVLLLPLLLTIPRIEIPRNFNPERLAREAAQAGEAAAVRGVIQRTRGPVYSEDMTLLVQAGKSVPLEPAIMTSLSKAGVWDEREFVGRIARQYFEAIVIRELDNTLRFSPAVQSTIAKAYAPAQTIGPYTIYAPRTAEPGIRAYAPATQK